VRFTLYSEKTVRQCMSALTDRMEVKGTKSRPEIDGWIEKGGKFSIAMTSSVASRFNRTTRLRGTAKRESGVTIIKGFVPSGAPRSRVALMILALLIVAAIMLVKGNGVLSIFAALTGFALYIPLVGDYHNSAYLYKELKKATKGKDKPPKK